MKHFLVIAIIFSAGISSIAKADDLTTTFVNNCAERAGKTSSFCECAINAYSAQLREGDEKKLISLETYYSENKKGLLADPAITEEKLSNVCDLHDQALEAERKAGLIPRGSDRQVYDTLRKQKVEFLNQKQKLVEGYNPTAPVLGALISGNFCDERHKLNQVRADQAEDEELIYASLRRILKGNPTFSSSAVFRAASKKGCR